MTKPKPLDDFESFELLQVIDPKTFTDELYEDAGDYEQAVIDRYGVDVEAFGRIAGDLLPCTPVIQFALTGTNYHALGENDHEHRTFRAAVTLEVGE